VAWSSRKKRVCFPSAGREVAVTIYYPAARDEAPVVIVAHGFTRSKRYMAGCGADLAAQGITAIVPTQPALADHALNARALAEIVEKIRSGELKLRVKANKKVGLMGFSMGGLTTLLAASKTSVDAWVGLDPVDMDGSGAKAAATLDVPSAILCAEPEPWNLNGNARGLIAVLPKVKLAVKVRHETRRRVSHRSTRPIRLWVPRRLNNKPPSSATLLPLSRRRCWKMG
jgi:dienelactone hydrolase